MASRAWLLRSVIRLSATSAAMDTCTSPRLAARPLAVASLVATALRPAPKRSSSQLASSPIWKLLPELSPPRVPWLADAEIPKAGCRPAAATSRSARACRNAAWLLRTVVLDCRARATNEASTGSWKCCHQAAALSDVVPAVAARVVPQAMGTSGSPGRRISSAWCAQPASNRPAAQSAGLHFRRQGRPCAVGFESVTVISSQAQTRTARLLRTRRNGRHALS